MKVIGDIRRPLCRIKNKLKKDYYIKEIGIFGSYVRNEQKKGSDVDILVEFNKPVGLFEFVRLKNYLSEFLGIKVDLVMKKALKPRIGQRILKELIHV